MSATEGPRQWLQLRLEIGKAEQEALEGALFDCGALAVSLEDAGDEPVFEEGETWTRGILVALFDPAEHQQAEVLACLREAIPGFEGTPSFEILQEQDWVALTQAQFQPRQFGKRLWVLPTWSDAPANAEILLRLDPGQAFGTGAHPTTTLCLEWLDQQVQGGELVLDYGCGSGILAIAALLLGAKEAFGVDTDPVALEVARENARMNGVEDRLWLGLPAEFMAQHGNLEPDLLVANILAGPLRELAPELASHCRPGGQLALSGILAEQADWVAAAYEKSFALVPPVQQEEWIRLEGTRKS
ncbi:50S ribosomal protein L11 methyltransferase [Thermithiobacillus plumbiphilus]|uniref:Ribosomal protein L11 methyltransferase n=1 Tax=Thermithiobacillus plumbiphilus TaxID=1729899 RepID=A0ABU9DB84_9PROT